MDSECRNKEVYLMKCLLTILIVRFSTRRPLKTSGTVPNLASVLPHYSLSASSHYDELRNIYSSTWEKFSLQEPGVSI